MAGQTEGAHRASLTSKRGSRGAVENRARRSLRHAVWLRKNSDGNDSVAGARFIERLLTARGSLRRQGRCLLGMVAAGIATVRNPAVRRSLLPAAV